MGGGGQGPTQDTRGKVGRDVGFWRFGDVFAFFFSFSLFFFPLPFLFLFFLGGYGEKETGTPHPDDRALLRRGNVRLAKD